MDLNMPISDGYDASRKIRAFYNQKKTVKFKKSTFEAKIDISTLRPIIAACTSENVSNPYIADKISEANFDLTLSSPIVKRRLIEYLLPYIE